MRIRLLRSLSFAAVLLSACLSESATEPSARSGRLAHDSVLVLLTGNAQVPVVGFGIDGSRIAAIASPGILGVSAAVVTLPNGKGTTIFLDAAGYPHHAIMDGVVYTYTNYSDSTVDLTAFTFGGKVSTTRRIVLPTFIAAGLQEQHARYIKRLAPPGQANSVRLSMGPLITKTGNSLATAGQISSSQSIPLPTIDELWSSVVMAAGTIGCVNGAPAAAATAFETAGISVAIWASLCTATVVTIGAKYTGTEGTPAALGAEIISAAGGVGEVWKMDGCINRQACLELIQSIGMSSVELAMQAGVDYNKVQSAVENLLRALRGTVDGTWSDLQSGTASFGLTQSGGIVWGQGILVGEEGPIQLFISGSVYSRTVFLTFSSPGYESAAFSGTLSATSTLISGVLWGSGFEGDAVTFAIR